MAERIPSTRDLENQIVKTVNEVKQYVNKIHAEPDDSALLQLKILKESIQSSANALIEYQFSKEREDIQFDSYIEEFDKAINQLNERESVEKIEEEVSDSHVKLANELVVASNAILTLVALLRSVQESKTISPVPLTDASYKRGLKTTKAAGGKFNQKK